MKKFNLWKTALVVFMGGLLIFLFFQNNLPGRTFSLIHNFDVSRIFYQASWIRSFLSEVKKINNLTKDNIDLKEENLKLLSRVAELLELKIENDQLREALGVPPLTRFQLIDGGVFGIQFTPTGQKVLINKGSDSGIVKNNTITSYSGVLLGQVDEVFDSHLVAITVTDPEFKATIRVMDKNTTGIARGGLEDGVLLDFISQQDEIEEGDMIVTSGNDHFAPGLLIGKVSFVDSSGGGLFKKVKVSPLIKDVNLSKVIIIK